MGPSKLRNRVLLEICSKWNSDFQNWSKALCLGVSEPTNRFTAQSAAYVLRNRRNLWKKMKKNICVKEIWICKILEIYRWIFFPTNDFLLLESCQLYISAKYKASNCFKIEAIIQRCLAKFTEIHPAPESLFKLSCCLKRDSGTGVFLWI